MPKSDTAERFLKGYNKPLCFMFHRTHHHPVKNQPAIRHLNPTTPQPLFLKQEISSIPQLDPLPPNANPTPSSSSYPLPSFKVVVEQPANHFL